MSTARGEKGAVVLALPPTFTYLSTICPPFISIVAEQGSIVAQFMKPRLSLSYPSAFWNGKAGF